MLQSWKTTVSGLVTSLAGLVLALSTSSVAIPKWAVITASFVLAGGFASLGIFGKDHDTK